MEVGPGAGNDSPNMALPRLSGDLAFVVTMTRYEYANVYWMMMELYNIFLTVTFFGKRLSDVNLLILDAHPNSTLDDLFRVPMKSSVRLGHLNQTIPIDTLAITLSRQYSPMLQKIRSPMPLLAEFRTQVLSPFSIRPITGEVRKTRCMTNSLSVLVVWRRDYISHPRNPEGKVARKVSNEGEFLSAIRDKFRNFSIHAVQLDLHPVAEQLKLVAESDIFIGMHGSAFGYVSLMSPGGGVLEMWPQYWGQNWHMEYLATRNGLAYKSWKNKHGEKERKKEWLTEVTPSEILPLIRELTVQICGIHDH